MSEGTSAADAACQFELGGDVASVKPYGSGHINDTYCATVEQPAGAARFIVQRINRKIFKDPAANMENIQRVTAHLSARIQGWPDRERRVPALVPAKDGRLWHADVAGNTWRAFRFIEGARTYDAVESASHAYHVAKAVGEFQRLLIDLPGPRLHETLPDFHHTPKRFEALQRAIEADVAGRAGETRAEIEFALDRQPITGVLLAANLPERITHNDTKFNNIMIDDATGEGLCLIDLDTVMPGLVLYDFGDMARTATSPAAEDETDLSLVKMVPELFEALVRGYLAAAGGFLTRGEVQHLAFSAKLITFEMGIRFLTDYLAGDTYYKIARPSHNLDRSRTQFRLVESMEEQEKLMETIILQEIASLPTA